ncbi:MAG: hypothetical protein ACOCP4_06900 [Candidatus Woesearchaeota archaeon]
MTNPCMQTIEDILCSYTLYKEIVPYKGEIDYEKKRITINPAFDMIETLAHEILHHYYDITLKTGATEWFVRENARELIKDKEVSEIIKKYTEKAKPMPSKNIFSTV